MAYSYLNNIKKMLGITGSYQDDILGTYAEEAIAYMVNAGVDEDTAKGEDAVGVVARGVSDLWNYGSGEVHLSDYFKERVVQLAYKAKNSPNNPDPEEEKVSYDDLSDKPILNGIIIEGDKKSKDYGLQPENYIVNISGDEETGYKADKTLGEIIEAHEAGRMCYAKHLLDEYNMFRLVSIIEYEDGPYEAMFKDENVAALRTTVIYITKDEEVIISMQPVAKIPTQNDAGLVNAQTILGDEEGYIPVEAYRLKPGFLAVKAQPKDFVVNIQIEPIDTEDGIEYQVVSVDKTLEEIYEAVQGGSRCVADVTIEGMTELKVDCVSVNTKQAVFNSVGSGSPGFLINITVAVEDNNCMVDIWNTPYPINRVTKLSVTELGDLPEVKADFLTGKLYVSSTDLKNYVLRLTVNVTMNNDDGSITADKTYQEIKDAWENGRDVVLNYGSEGTSVVIRVASVINDDIIFVGHSLGANNIIEHVTISVNNENKWNILTDENM